MKPLTISLLKQYRKNLLYMLLLLFIESIFLYGLRDEFSHPRFVDFIIITQLAVVVFAEFQMTRFQILDENGITIKRMIGSKTYGWDRVLNYELADAARGFQKLTVIRVMFDGSVNSVGLDYSEEAMAWMRYRCGAPSSDKRKKPSP